MIELVHKNVMFFICGLEHPISNVRSLSKPLDFQCAIVLLVCPFQWNAFWVGLFCYYI